MKYTLTTNEAVRLLLEDEYANWSRAGATALVTHLDDVSPDMELDRVALRCDYAEFKTASEAAENLYGEQFADEEEARTLLSQEDVLVAEFDGGVIVRNA